MKFKIVQFDNDYHTVVDWEYKEFKSKEEANRWCKDNSWSGESYSIGDWEYDGPDYPLI